MIQRIGTYALYLIMLVFQPLVLIWAINVILPIDVPITWMTLLASAAILVLLKPIRFVFLNVGEGEDGIL